MRTETGDMLLYLLYVVLTVYVVSLGVFIACIFGAGDTDEDLD